MKSLKKLGKLKLMPEKMLNQNDLINFKGGCTSGETYFCCQYIENGGDVVVYGCWGFSALECEAQAQGSTGAYCSQSQMGQCM